MEKNQFSLSQLLVVCFIISLVIPLCTAHHEFAIEKSRQIKCKGNLDIIGKSVKVYAFDYGNNIFYPDTNGGGFAARLYQLNMVKETEIYICPSTSDITSSEKLNNLLAEDSNEINATSYAGRKNKKQYQYPGLSPIIPGTRCSASVTPMVADDWNQGQEENHENGEVMIFLFRDGHSDHMRSSGGFDGSYSSLLDPLTN